MVNATYYPQNSPVEKTVDASPYNIIDEVDCNLSRTKIIRDKEMRRLGSLPFDQGRSKIALFLQNLCCRARL